MAMRSMLLTASLFVLAGCGPGYKVEFQSQSSITYWYDPARQSMGTVQHHAQEYCSQYGKDALPQASSGDAFTGISISFVCKTPG
jgi:hypothetical protein